MAVHTITVVLFEATEAAWLVEAAAEVARGFDAHLIALHPFNPVVWANGLGGDAVIYASILDWEEKESAKIRHLFEERLRRDGLAGEFRRQTNLYGAETFVLQGCRPADLVILGGTAELSPDDRILAQRVVREGGRPALVLGPGTRLRGPARRVVIGWTETREATRAAHDALALAAPGAEVTLVSFHARAGGEAPGMNGRDDLATALHRAGFAVTVADLLSGTDELPETMVTFAKEREADLLVTGAFGHSQIYDLFVGAVTRSLLDKADLPVLLSR